MRPIATQREARDTDHSLPVPVSLQFDPESMERLESGVEVAECLLNPRLIPVRLKSGKHVRLELPRQSGESLESRVIRSGPLDPNQANEIAAQAADAVASLHRAEQPHGAVTAENVPLTGEGTVQLECAGAYEYFRHAPPVAFAGLYMDPKVGYQEAGRRADMEGLRLVLLYALFGSAEEDSTRIHTEKSGTLVASRTDGDAIPNSAFGRQ